MKTKEIWNIYRVVNITLVPMIRGDSSMDNEGLKMKFPYKILIQLMNVLISIPFVSWAQDSSDLAVVPLPEDQLENFVLQPGFKIELVASEKDGVIKPVEIKFDDAGRLWTLTARMFPLDPLVGLSWDELELIRSNPEKLDTHPVMVRFKRMFRGEIPGQDQILILERLNNEKDLKVHVWEDQLVSPMSILPHKTGAFVAQGSEIFFLDDTDGDGMADHRTALFTGFGFTDSHAMVHGLVKGPDNWIHFSHGGLNQGLVRSLVSGDSMRMDYSKIARFKNDGTEIELLNSGLNNIWGYSLRNDGLWYGSEANDLGYSVTPMQPGMGFPGIGNERLRFYQPLFPPQHSFRVGGTGLSGLAFSNDLEGTFYDRYQDAAFLANPVTGAINVVKINRDTKGEIKSKLLEDLLISTDDWFRPVDVQFGPDGCLYIADWCHTIVSHNEVELPKENDEKMHGRIWRICGKDQKERRVPDFYTMNTEDLPGYLSSVSLWERRAAWNQIAERTSEKTDKIVEDLVQIVQGDSYDVYTRIHALWSLESIGRINLSLIKKILKDPSVDIQREAIRAIGSVPLVSSEMIGLVRPFMNSENAEIRAQVLRTIGKYRSADQEMIELLVSACKSELSKEVLDGSYERNQERFLARIALEKFPDQLYRFLRSESANALPLENRLWAMQVLSKERQKEIFRKAGEAVLSAELSSSDFLGILEIADDFYVFILLQEMIYRSEQKEEFLLSTLENHTRIDRSVAGKLFEKIVENMLEDNDKDRIQLAVEAVMKFNIDKGEQAVIECFGQSKELPVQHDILRILSKNTLENADLLMSIVKDRRVDFTIRIAAMHILTKANFDLGQGVFAEFWDRATPLRKKEIVEVYSFSRNGSEVILDGLDSGIIDDSAINVVVAERIHHLVRDHRSETLLRRHKQRSEGERRVADEKIEELLTMVEDRKGVVKQGKEIFETTCLACHQVGGKGYDIAPALDGSAYRSTPALLTAIVEPDAAVESGYSTYRITKNDGSVVEGLLYKKTDRGTTLAFQGGSKLFISAEKIIQEGYLFGRSFMPAGLIEDYSVQQVADLLAFIKTLE